MLSRSFKIRCLFDVWKVFQERTRRERLKLALYLRLKKRKVFKIVKGGTLSTFWKSSLLQNIWKNWKRDPLESLKKSKHFLKKFSKNEKFEESQCRKTRKGDLLGCLKLQVAAKYQKTWRDPLATKKYFKKSGTVPKKYSKGDLVVPSGFVPFVKNWVHKRGTLCTNLDAFPLAGPVV